MTSIPALVNKVHCREAARGDAPGHLFAETDESAERESESSGATERFGGEVIGHVGVVERTISTCWNWRYRVASFQGVSVAPNWRRQGIAQRLLDLSLEETKRRGYPFAILFCREPLVPFYRALGWRLPEDSMIMWKDLMLPISMRSNCPMYRELTNLVFPEGPIDVHNPIG